MASHTCGRCATTDLCVATLRPAPPRIEVQIASGASAGTCASNNTRCTTNCTCPNEGTACGKRHIARATASQIAPRLKLNNATGATRSGRDYDTATP